MIVVPDYRGFRIDVNTVAVDGRHNGEVRILRLFSREKPPRPGGGVLEADRRAGRASRAARPAAGRYDGRPEHQRALPA